MATPSLSQIQRARPIARRRAEFRLSAFRRPPPSASGTGAMTHTAMRVTRTRMAPAARMRRQLPLGDRRKRPYRTSGVGEVADLVALRLHPEWMAGAAPDKVLNLAEAVRQRLRIWMAPIALKTEAGVPEGFNLLPLLCVRSLRSLKATPHPLERSTTPGAARLYVLAGSWIGGNLVGPVATEASVGDPIYWRASKGERS
jgi:hypothetical protein